MGQVDRAVIIACGALAHEIVALRTLNDWPHLDVQCLPADLHNRPEKIAPAIRAKIHAARARYGAIFVAYGDCGTGGALDVVLAEEKVERIPGSHCYEFFAGSQVFSDFAEAELGTFYLTDFLARHFERLVIRGLGIDRHPELQGMYFGHYRKLVYLCQREDAQNLALARQAAERLGLEFEYRFTGYGELAAHLQQFNESVVTWQS